MATNHASKWTPEDKIRIVLESINTKISTADLCRKYNVSPNAIYDCKEKFISAARYEIVFGSISSYVAAIEYSFIVGLVLLGANLLIYRASAKKVRGEGVIDRRLA